MRLKAMVGVAGAISLALATTSLCTAATVNVPTVTISQLSHCPPQEDFVCDAISIPGPGYTSSGFNATLATGDVVRVRFEAPPGKRFYVHAPPQNLVDLGKKFFYFVINTYWLGAGETSSHVDPHTVVFEDFQGTMPTEVYSLVTTGDHGRIVEIWKEYEVHAAFEFTAIQFDITVSGPIAPETHQFSDVLSYQGPASWGASISRPGSADATLMEIVDTAVPTHATSWGRLKSIYR